MKPISTEEQVYNIEDFMIEPKIIEDVLTYPTSFFPENINEFCRYSQESLNIQSDFIKNSMLSVIGQAIGMNSVIEIKNEWKEPAIVWTCNVGDPSEKKSPALNIATKPTEKLEEEEDEKYELLLEEYETELEQYQIELKIWEAKKNRKLPDKPKEPKKPIQKEHFVKNVTMEGLYPLLKTNAILVIADEFTSLLSGMNQYKGGKGNDEQEWLALINGGSVKKSRSGTEKIKSKSSTSVNISGGTQPEILAPFLTKLNGFPERIFYSYPKPLKRVWSDVQIPQILVEAYRDFIYKLHDITNPYKDQPFIVKFSEDGYKAFCTIVIGELYSVINAPDTDKRTRSLYGKFEGYFGRLCLLKYWVDVAQGREHNGLVNSIQVMEAWEVMEYYISHAKKVFSIMGGDEDEKELQQILLKIKEGFGGFITARELTQSIRRIKNTNEAHRWIERIVNEGYGYPDTLGKKNGIRLYEL